MFRRLVLINHYFNDHGTPLKENYFDESSNDEESENDEEIKDDDYSDHDSDLWKQYH